VSRLNRALAYLAALGLLAPLGRTGWQLWDLAGPGALPPVATLAEAADQGPDPSAGAQPPSRRLAGWDPFGRAVEARASAPPPPVEAPKTALQLTLRGVAASLEPRSARAIVAEAGGRERQYRVGDTLPGGAEVVEVRPDRVLLRRNGRYETLPLARTERRAGTEEALTGALGPALRRSPAAFQPQPAPALEPEPPEPGAPEPEPAESTEP
jgi:general secretion pathway protein C